MGGLGVPQECPRAVTPYDMSWIHLGEDFGRDETGCTEWYSGGPSVSVSGTGDRIAVGLESTMNDAGKEVSVLRVFVYQGI